MKNFNPIFLFLIFINVVQAQDKDWHFVKGKIATEWAEQVRPTNLHKEYPRPQLQRDSWVNLNGLWDYAVRNAQEDMPSTYDGKILVPFPIESALSGVSRSVHKENKLWYRRTFRLDEFRNAKNILLHFGAIDWHSVVYINGSKVGEHKGGYDPFTFNITQFVKKTGSNELVVSVWDPSDEGPQPRGKQVKDPNSIWYTPVTGIWQTVWIEPVNTAYISSTKQSTDFDNKKLNLTVHCENFSAGDKVNVTILDGTEKLFQSKYNQANLSIPVPFAKAWSPLDPKLYQLEIAIERKGKVMDRVKSYFAMRKISIEKDSQGMPRMMINNSFVFQYGPLDQGWWPDGLYTAPTDDALRSDIEKTKAMGFNMIRKHVKVEPARWYYYCDVLGMLVWQDMPSGDMGNRWDSRPAVIGVASDKDRTTESESIYKNEWPSIISSLYNFPSIVVWVPFNEGWGQFKTTEIVQMTRHADSTRLINEASGGNYAYSGDMIDLHNYPLPAMPDPRFFKSQVLVLGEFGGLGLPLEGHTWKEKDNWGYQSFSTKEDLFKKYEALIDDLKKLIPAGLSAAVYTQTSDVEIEVNGLMTYDRKVTKMPAEALMKLHQGLYDVKVE